MLSNPNLDAADTGVDPSTGRYLTKKERIGIFKRRKIKASNVFGKKSSALAKVGNIRGPLARFGAIVKTDDSDIIKKDQFPEGDNESGEFPISHCPISNGKLGMCITLRPRRNQL